MAVRPCLDCDAPTTKSRCLTCTAVRQRARDAQRGTTTERGLGWDHQRQRDQQVTEVPYCERCGHTGSIRNPLTGEHTTPRAHGGTDVDMTLCRSCNSSRGATVRR
jgi:hypothetical protein